MVRIRAASPEDLGRIAEIYNYYIRNSTATFRENEYTQQEITEKFEEIHRAYPFLAAEDGSDGVAGFAYVSRFREPSAYRLAESTIYLSPRHLNRGIGKSLYSELIQEARRRNPNLTGLVACITLENKGSASLAIVLGVVGGVIVVAAVITAVAIVRKKRASGK